MLARLIEQKGGRAYYAGGYVRDLLSGINPSGIQDKDIEIFGISCSEFIHLLEPYAEARVVGKVYPLVKLRGYPEWDFTFPLRPDLSLREACRRRDFTINAMLIDVLSGELFDFFQGQEDLGKKVIRQTTSRVIAEDPLRAYRACRLAAQLGFSIEEQTIQAIGQADLGAVAAERIYEELRRLLLSDHPAIGLRYMEESGLLTQVHPELYALVDCEQSPKNHPEGSVWEHTLLVVEQASRRKDLSRDAEVFMLAALLHDIAKPLVTRQEKDKVTAYGHDTRGGPLAYRFLEQLRAPRRTAEAVADLVREHMHPVLLYKQREQITDKAIRRLVSRIDVSELLLLAEADYCGRTLKRDFTPIKEWLTDYINRLDLSLEGGFPPVVQGRDLMAMGIPPGKDYARLLDYAYEWQLQGCSREEILRRLEELIVR
ncbi:MAG TPA: CCA tRNA nucleotidyltransferase [Syntrophomonadaceae bacterium]|nr:CCA tRNA nucleotidyltransferase [Syntrophomonadaceae bacterium]